MRDFINQPSKKTVFIFVSLWLFSNLLLLLAITDLFTQPLLQRQFLMVYILILMSTAATFRIVLKYLKNKKSQ